MDNDELETAQVKLVLEQQYTALGMYFASDSALDGKLALFFGGGAAIAGATSIMAGPAAVSGGGSGGWLLVVAAVMALVLQVMIALRCWDGWQPMAIRYPGRSDPEEIQKHYIDVDEYAATWEAIHSCRASIASLVVRSEAKSMALREVGTLFVIQICVGAMALGLRLLISLI